MHGGYNKIHILRDKSASQQEGKSVEQTSNTVPMDIVRMNEMKKMLSEFRGGC